jgi:concentrative nucleoside transporter, CNT family
VIQWLVTIAAKFMKRFMQTSGAETLAAIENIFMGQSEAPLIVRPYVATMTNSELLALMTGGMATLSGGMIAVYIAMGVDSVALLASSVMAAPCSLYLAKLLLPETGAPLTMGQTQAAREKEHANALDAIASGADRGMRLAISIAAMLIAFLALIACLDFLLNAITPALSLQKIFAWVFSPFAFLIGAPDHDIMAVANLLGTKAVTNEFVAYAQMTAGAAQLDARSLTLATFALGGFANLGSIGIQLGALAVIAPERRADFARLGPKAFLAGYLATLINAAVVGAIM